MLLAFSRQDLDMLKDLQIAGWYMIENCHTPDATHALIAKN